VNGEGVDEESGNPSWIAWRILAHHRVGKLERYIPGSGIGNSASKEERSIYRGPELIILGAVGNSFKVGGPIV
jgi:hypothetical protein